MLEFPFELNNSNLYNDLVLEFSENGHNIYVIAPSETNQKKSILKKERGLNVLRVKTLKQRGVKSFFRKGLAQLLLPIQYNKAYNKFLKHIKFDLIIMPTPPITLISVVENIKKRTQAKFYLILRDIYPQGAADIGLVKLKIAFYYLRYLERKIYLTADYIGCMSQGNIDYISKHNPYLPIQKLVLLPNWQKEHTTNTNSSNIRKKYNLENKYLVLFGGTIGYAQKVENIVLLANHYRSNEQILFLVIGNGVKKKYLQELTVEAQLQNVIFMNSLPRDEYLNFVECSDIGLITIDERFTVPTLPSKTTSYLCLKLPVLAIVDAHTDYGKMLEESNAGLWSVEGNDKQLYENFDLLYNDPALRQKMGNAGFNYFLNYLTSEKAYRNIMNLLKNQTASKI